MIYLTNAACGGNGSNPYRLEAGIRQAKSDTFGGTQTSMSGHTWGKRVSECLEESSFRLARSRASGTFVPASRGKGQPVLGKTRLSVNPCLSRERRGRARPYVGRTQPETPRSRGWKAEAKMRRNHCHDRLIRLHNGCRTRDIVRRVSKFPTIGGSTKEFFFIEHFRSVLFTSSNGCKTPSLKVTCLTKDTAMA